MGNRKYVKRSISLLLVMTLLLSVFAQMGIVASATKKSDYDASIIYNAKARVDESVGLRATVEVEGGLGKAVGINPLNVSMSRPNRLLDVSDDNGLKITVDPYTNYTVSKIAVVAIAEIEHLDGTVEAVKDIKNISANDALPTITAPNYTIPDFRGFVKNGETINVEVVVYTDLAYTTNPVDYDINLTTGVVTAFNGKTATDIATSGNTFVIDTAINNVAGSTVYAYGKTGGIDSGHSSNLMHQLYIDNTSAVHTKDNRRINLILEDASMLSHSDSDRNSGSANYFKTYTVGRIGNTIYASAKSTAPGNYTRAATLLTGGSTQANGYCNRTASPLTLANVDAYVTLKGDNVMANSSVAWNWSVTECAITVDASSSLIFTDASTGTLYARGNSCSSGIGTTQTNPTGYIQVDGGDVTVESANTTHSYAGIGNGGHYSAKDPGMRGVVVNGGKLNALGFHYGIGANGGDSMPPTMAGDSGDGAQYIVMTGGDVVAEASAGSAGAAIGFAYNNDLHEVRIGRPDKGTMLADGSVTSINWGYGAAISGKMTFYSGTTKAYSGNYSAAIGGNAVSNATIEFATEAQAQAGASAVTGTPLTVYGGKVEAEAGRFEQELYGTLANRKITSPKFVRGENGSRLSASAITSEPRATVSYGAAIGGAIGKSGGTQNRIFGGDFNVTSSKYGAGIGGGGGYTTTIAAGSGGETRIGNLYDRGTGAVASMNFVVKPQTGNTYGAGFGGGGTDVANKPGGSGGDVFIGGGKFTVTAGDYGAGFGGGGSLAGDGGAGGTNLVISGGEFEVTAGTYGAGIGGGGAEGLGNGGNGATNLNIDGGKFTINAGTYGAGIGGGGAAMAGNGGNGADTVISGGDFIINTNTHGAGIGGGGSNSGNGGNDGTDLTINGGKFKIEPKGGHTSVSPANTFGAGIGGGGSSTGNGGNGAANFTVNPGANLALSPKFDVYSGYDANTPSTTASYGAGIGGGGSGSGDGGDGAAVFTGKGGIFNVFSNGYGAAIGGGGSDTGAGGSAGESTYTGGTVKALANNDEFPLTVGMGGGVGDTTLNPDGAVLVTGGNVATYVKSVLNGATLTGTNVWTLPNTFGTGAIGGGVGETSSTSEPVVMKVPASFIGKQVDDVEFTAMDPSGVIVNYKATYGTKDTIVTKAEGSSDGEIWLWIPSYMELNYDLGTGYDSQTVIPGIDKVDPTDDFDIAYAQKMGTGEVTLKVSGNEAKDAGTKVDLLTYDQYMGAGTDKYDWTVGGTSAFSTVGDGTISPGGTPRAPLFTDFIYHPDVNGRKVKFLGWTDQKDITTNVGGVFETKNDSSTGEHIFDLADGWDYKDHMIKNVQFDKKDITVYAMWGYDLTGEGIADVLQTDLVVTYDAQGGSPTPTNGTKYSPGDKVTISSTSIASPKKADGTSEGYIFMGWTEDDYTVPPISAPLAISTQAELDKIKTAGGIYIGGTGTLTFGGGHSLTGDKQLTMPAVDTTLYAIWGKDANGNGIPDVYDPKYKVIYNNSQGGSTHEMEYVDGETVKLDVTLLATGFTPPAATDRFIGWTEDNAVDSEVYDLADMAAFKSIVYGHPDPATLAPGIIEKPTISVTIAGGDIDVYAVWGDDSNVNGIADVLEPTYKFVFDPMSTAVDPVSVPKDDRHYIDGMSPDTANNNLLNEADAAAVVAPATPMTSYMVRPDWYFEGWTSNKSVAGDYTIDPTGSVGAKGAAPWVENDPAVLASLLTFAAADIKIYAVWSEDANNNGIPDWDEGPAGNRIEYFPALPTGLELDPATVKYEKATSIGGVVARTYVDDNSGSFYSDKSTVNIDWKPEATEGFVFMGWSPVRPRGELGIGADLNLYNLDGFGERLAQIEDLLSLEVTAAADIVAGINGSPEAGSSEISKATYTNVGGRNQTGVVSFFDPLLSPLPPTTAQVPIGSLTHNTTDTVKFTIEPGLEGLYKDALKYTNTKGNFEKVQIEGSAASGVNADDTASYAKKAVNVDSLAPALTHTEIQIGDYYTEARKETYGKKDWIGEYGTLGAYNGQGHIKDITFPGLTEDYLQANDDTWRLFGVWAVDANNNGIADAFEETYKLEFDSNGGTPANIAPKVGMFPGTTHIVKPITSPSKLDANGNGMTLLGWTTNTTVKGHYSTGERKQIPEIVSAVTFADFDIKVYAVWAEDLDSNGIPDVFEDGFVLSYDANGGTGVPASTLHQYLEEATVATTGPVHASGHMFLNWTTDATVASVYTLGEKDLLPVKAEKVKFELDDITLYAVWSTDNNGNGLPDVYEDSYELFYNGNGGTPAPTDANSYVWGDKVTLDAGAGMTNGSNILLGWTEDTVVATVYEAGQQSFLPVMKTEAEFATGNITVTAVWSTDKNDNGDPDVYEDQYAVTYDNNGGTGSQTDAGNPYLTETSALVLSKGSMEKVGYVFDSWNTAKNGSGTYYNEDDALLVTGDITLFAQWKQEPNNYTVTYDANTGIGGTQKTVAGMTDHKVLTAKEAGVSNADNSLKSWNTKADGTGNGYTAGSSLIVSADVTLYAQWEKGSTEIEDVVVTYDANGGNGGKQEKDIKVGTRYTILTDAAAGVSKVENNFVDWNTKADGTGTSYDSGDRITISKNMTLYAQWEKKTIVLTADHIAYISGYPDGGVRPDGLLTRAEVAAIFFKLLDKDTHPDKDEKIDQKFSDVKAGAWYYQAVSYLEKKGVLSGYTDGTFKPEKEITRAEFAVVAAKFDSKDYDGVNHFKDVKSDHWALEEINSAYNKGWISGYEDKTFRPESCIKRGEAASLVNGVLSRKVDAATLKTLKSPFPDLKTGHWAYPALMEATIAHQYTLDNKDVETWVPGSYKN